MITVKESLPSIIIVHYRRFQPTVNRNQQLFGTLANNSDWAKALKVSWLLYRWLKPTVIL